MCDRGGDTGGLGILWRGIDAGRGRPVPRWELRVMSKAKLISVAVLAVLAVVIVLQNTDAVSTRLLFFTVTMPRAFLLLITGLLGFAAGVLVALTRSKK